MGCFGWWNKVGMKNMNMPPHQFTVNNIRFEFHRVKVRGSNNRFSAKLKSADRDELAPLCNAISTCWSREGFVSLIVDRAGQGIEDGVSRESLKLLDDSFANEIS
jgi:hypothetical protein